MLNKKFTAHWLESNGQLQWVAKGQKISRVKTIQNCVAKGQKPLTLTLGKPKYCHQHSNMKFMMLSMANPFFPTSALHSVSASLH